MKITEITLEQMAVLFNKFEEVSRKEHEQVIESTFKISDEPEQIKILHSYGDNVHALLITG